MSEPAPAAFAQKPTTWYDVIMTNDLGFNESVKLTAWAEDRGVIHLLLEKIYTEKVGGFLGFFSKKVTRRCVRSFFRDYVMWKSFPGCITLNPYAYPVEHLELDRLADQVRMGGHAELESALPWEHGPVDEEVVAAIAKETSL